MEKIEIQKRLTEIIAKHASISPLAITPEKNMKLDLGLDSLDVAEMVYEIEEQFGVSITDDSADKLQRVGDAIEYIHERMISPLKT
jgi:acyl carrier protein